MGQDQLWGRWALVMNDCGCCISRFFAIMLWSLRKFVWLCFTAFRTDSRLPGWRFYPLRWALITIPTSLRISRKHVCSWLQCCSREIGFFFDTNLLLLLPPVSSILCTDVLFFRWCLLSQSRVPSQDTLATSTRDRELRCSARRSARRL